MFKNALRRLSLAAPGRSRALLLTGWLLGAALASLSAQAAPWLEVGDRTLRSDVELLAAHGLIDSLVTTWPIPAGQMSRLNNARMLAHQPAYVQAAAQRVLARLLTDGQPRGWGGEAGMRRTHEPDTIRDFGTQAREDTQAQAGLSYDGNRFAMALRVSNQPSKDRDGHDVVGLDGSYLTALVDNWQVYAGWVDQWYGPGWTSSLTLSNNARPVPKIGLMRNSPHAFESPWLSWIGPWQLNTFFGVLDGPRIDRNTLYLGVRLTVEPLRNLELGASRTSEVCGTHHQCSILKEEFHPYNSSSNPNPVNDQGTIDAKYTLLLGSMTVSPYAQIMNEDNGPFTHAAASYLAGTSVAGPFGQDGAHWRITAEYTDSVATLNWFDFGKKSYGAAYTDYKYFDGMRYRGRSLGFSLDSDSRLFSLAAALTTAGSWTYRLVYYRANINTPTLAAIQQAGNPPYLYNVVSARPAQFDQIEAGLSIPARNWLFDLSLRGQDARVYPEPGGSVSGEIGVGYRF